MSDFLERALERSERLYLEVCAERNELQSRLDEAGRVAIGYKESFDQASADLIDAQRRLDQISKDATDYPLLTLYTIKDALFCCSEDPQLEHARRVLDVINSILVVEKHGILDRPYDDETSKALWNPKGSE